jgi:hypothetical protein
LAAPSVGWSADYKQEAFDKRARDSHRYVVSQILSGQRPLEANSEAFATYFRQVFAEMTRLESRGDLAKMRLTFYRQMRDTKDPGVLKELNDLTLKAMTQLCRENYHPATRYNAALILGDLDQELWSRYGGATNAPVPFSEVVPVLVEFLTDDQMIDAVKVAALVGLQRHARYGLAASVRGSVTDAMLALLQTKEPPAGRSPAGHVWMRRQAAEVLAQIGAIGEQNRVFDALVSVVTDAEAPVALRCAAAAAVGQLKYDGDAKVDVGTVVSQLGDLAVDILKQELRLARRLLNRREAVPPGSGRTGDDTGMDATEDDGLFPRRQLASRVDCVRQGLIAIKGQAEEPSKALADQISAELEGILKLMEDKNLPDNGLIDDVAKVQGDIEAAVREARPAAPGGPEERGTGAKAGAGVPAEQEPDGLLALGTL